jgi:DNA-binding NtrC family response regulator
VDFRLISSSRSSIAELEANRGMRADFLYRINAEVAEIPPLRERREDIRPIVEEVLHEWADRNAAAEPYLHPEACARLEEHSWPGNARELVNEIERVLVARPIEITPDMLFANLLVSSPRAAPVPSFREERNRMERTLLIRALEMERGNATQAAKVLKITRRYLGTLLAKHGIELERFRERVSSPLTGDGRPGGKKRGKPSRGEARQQGPREKGSRQNRSDST